MAGDFIKVDMQMNGAAYAPELYAIVTQLKAWRGRAQGLKNTLDHMIDGVDFTEMESFCGLAPGEGALVYNFLNGTLGNMNGQFGAEANGKNLSERVG